VPPTFLVAAPPYGHKSAGVRALYRLCHHLNAAGYSAAMAPLLGATEPPPGWLAPVHGGAAGDGIVVYPEIVPGNPLRARKVVRWALNNPGLLGGDARYPDSEMVFVFNPERLALASRAVSRPLGRGRVLRPALIDPDHIYPRHDIPKTIDCLYVGRAQALRALHPLPDEGRLQSVEAATPTLASLGDLLRRTRTLYAYDHASTILKEAKICGCTVRVVGEDGRLHDPETCACAYNIYWQDDFRRTYARAFHDSSFVYAFVAELRTRWPVPGPATPRPAAGLVARIRGFVAAAAKRAKWRIAGDGTTQ
jgi:hypothetical protein